MYLWQILSSAIPLFLTKQNLRVKSENYLWKQIIRGEKYTSCLNTNFLVSPPEDYGRIYLAVVYENRTFCSQPSVEMHVK